jgi:quercetin dioxygenase-like cupin family protein
LEMLPREPTVKGPADRFTGDVWFDVIAKGEEPSRLRVNTVRFSPGDVVHTPPGEWHWHGAAPDRFMTHLAMWEAPSSGPESEWGDLVTDEEYGAR